jgi:lipopolysaccharide transport system ATP-binding protein
MSDTVIKVESLSKKYLIRHQQSERYTALRDVLTNKFKSFGKRLINLQPHSSNLQPSREEFWALKDISFEVKQGDRVGIIGRNGAGKTTLLKLLSRITEPTTGRIRIKGRVASLLEVGTGFHPELTGRENIYLNGAILGMSKAEIRSKFDEIVDFAEIEKFLDTPVKRYSSGMYVRLAFAVAAHLEPEVLLVDEVLAVGDAAFQKKCLGKMEDVSKREGRTVLFVSHNMGAISSLCQSGIFLGNGLLHSFDNVNQVVRDYMQMGVHWAGEKTWAEGIGDETFKLYAARILNENNEMSTNIDIQESFSVEFDYRKIRTSNSLRFGFQLISSDGTVVLTTEDGDYAELQNSEAGFYRSRVFVPANFLNKGTYYLTVGAHIPMQKILFLERECMSFIVEKTGGVGGYIDDGRRGVVRPLLRWENVVKDSN